MSEIWTPGGKRADTLWTPAGEKPVAPEQSPAAQREPVEDVPMPLPPATLEVLVFSLKTQAELYLGLFGMEEDEQPEVNLPLARHSIDMLGMLAEKTRGNLTMEEQRLIENSLTELRFRYIQRAEESKQK
jgi:hypothetical protein